MTHAYCSPAAPPAAGAILLHMCCGPCSLMPVLRLREEGFAVTGLFYNPNIHPLTEYLHRRAAAGLAAQKLGLTVLEADEQKAWDLPRWLADVNSPNLVGNPVGPARCAFCYYDRLLPAARLAKTRGFAAFTTSLLYSRRQNHDLIRREGERAALAAGVPFLYRDFRPDWQAGIDLSKEWGLYRQNYCGCIYSEAERFAGKLRSAHALPLNARSDCTS